MNLEEAKQILGQYRIEPPLTQREHKDEIIEAFRVFWSYSPSEKDFGEQLMGLVIFPEITYIMVKEGYGKGLIPTF